MTDQPRVSRGDEMTPRERVLAALRGDEVDRPPVSFWGHFYHRESTPADLVDATLGHQREFGWDWIKLNPRKHIHVEDWGVHYRYRAGRNEKPTLESWPVKRPEDWASIGEKDVARGALWEQVEAVRLLRARLPGVPIVQTVFTPLAALAELVPEPAELRRAMDSHGDAVRTALEAVTRTFERLVPRILEAGADGLFLATTDWASRDLMSAEEYRAWARPYDLRVLAAGAWAPFHVLHVCKRNNLVLELADYPVAAWSYDATDPTNPPPPAVLARVPGAFMGGLSQEGALRAPGPDRALAELHRALEQTGGRRWLAAPGCSIPPDVPAATLKTLRAAVAGLRAGAAGRSTPPESGSP
jgi:uroporphyrinogen decarboxylase